MKDEILIIAIIGADGTGKTTLAKRLAERHGGTYHSVHACLLKMYGKENSVKQKINRAAFTEFANTLRKEAGDAAIAVRSTVEEILNSKIPGIHFIESIQCLGEMDFMEEACRGRARLQWVGITGYGDDRIKWIDKNPMFKKMGQKNGAILLTQEWSDWSSTDSFGNTIVRCLDRIPIDDLFVNKGEIQRVLIEFEKKIKW
jgi:hypothetical protein